MTIKVMIGSTGPFSLICALAFMRSAGLDKLRTAVFHHVYHPSTLMDCQKWLCDQFGLEYLGDLSNIEHVAGNVLGKNKLSKLLHAPRFLFLFRRWAKKRFNKIDPEDIEHLILSFRPNIREVLLSSLFNTKNVYYVSEGALVGEPSSFELKMVWKLLGLKNPFGKKSKPEIWALPGMEKILHRFGKVRSFSREHFEDVANQVLKSRTYQKWKKALFQDSNPTECTCILLQNLYQGKWIDPFEEISFYSKIIKHELKNYNSTILVKPHPRDNPAKLELLKLLIHESERDRVIFMGINIMSSLPVEIMLKDLKISALSGLFSTSLVNGTQFSSIVARVYGDRALTLPVRNRLNSFIQATGLPLIEV